jgi:hypothetical protein
MLYGDSRITLDSESSGRFSAIVRVRTIAASVLLLAMHNALSPLAVGASTTLAQASIDAQVDECRRLALQRQGESIASYDSAATFDKQQSDVWSEKAETLLKAAKNAKIPIGKFGDQQCSIISADHRSKWRRKFLPMWMRRCG